MRNELTVVIPVYNVEKYLSKCIESILNQTLPVDEIILVDDGSKDRSGEIADEYAAKYNNIKVIHQENGGLSAARNTGIDAATKEYIAFVDSDDYIDSIMYERLMSQLQQDGADISILSMATLKKNALSCGSSSRKYLKKLRNCGMLAAERRERMQIRTVLMPCFVVKCSVPTAAIV